MMVRSGWVRLDDANELNGKTHKKRKMMEKHGHALRFIKLVVYSRQHIYMLPFYIHFILFVWFFLIVDSIT